MAPALVNKRHHLFVRINLMCISRKQNYRKPGSRRNPGKWKEWWEGEEEEVEERRAEERRGSLK